MKRASLLVCAAGGMVFLMAGCTPDIGGFLFARSDPVTGERVVVGSMETVAMSTKNTLTRLGLSAVVTNVGQEIHIASQTRRGARFEFILSREQTSQGERTHIRMHWLDNRDDQGVEILSELDRTHKPA